MKLFKLIRRLAPAKGQKMSDFIPFRWKLYLKWVEFIGLVKRSTKITTFVEDTNGRSRLMRYNGTFGPSGTVRIETQRATYIIWHTPAGIRYAYFSTPSWVEELTTAPTQKETQNDRPE